jgi:hypothetical protein
MPEDSSSSSTVLIPRKPPRFWEVEGGPREEIDIFGILEEEWRLKIRKLS